MSQSSTLDVAPMSQPRRAPELAGTTACLHERTFNAAEAAESESPVRNRQLFFRGGVRVSSASPVTHPRQLPLAHSSCCATVRLLSRRPRLSTSPLSTRTTRTKRRAGLPTQWGVCAPPMPRAGTRRHPSSGPQTNTQSLSTAPCAWGSRLSAQDAGEVLLGADVSC